MFSSRDLGVGVASTVPDKHQLGEHLYELGCTAYRGQSIEAEPMALRCVAREDIEIVEDLLVVADKADWNHDHPTQIWVSLEAGMDCIGYVRC